MLVLELIADFVDTVHTKLENLFTRIELNWKSAANSSAQKWKIES